MKTLTTMILGSALTLGLSFAAQQPSTTNPSDSTKTAPKAKKHSKKGKKAQKHTAPTAATPAPAPSK